MSVSIPLLRRDGSTRAAAMVDAGDAAIVTGHRWKLSVPGGYAATTIAGRTVYMHRLLMGLEPGDPRTVDHINRTRLDNRRSNLRVVSRDENYQNVGSASGSTSRHRGVFWDKTKSAWIAHATLSRRYYNLGAYATEDEAAATAAEFRLRHMPFATA